MASYKLNAYLDFVPLLSCLVKESSDTIIFFHGGNIIEIKKTSPSFSYVLENCNGLNRVRDIIDKTPYPKKNIIRFFKFLLDNDIVHIKQNFYKKYLNESSPLEYFESIGQNNDKENILTENKCEISPKCMPECESTLKKIMSARKSNRHLLLCKDLFNELDFLKIISSSKTSRSVPSAGGFYEIDIYMYLPMGTKRLKAGVYKFSQNDGNLSYIRGIDYNDLAFVFGTVQVLECTGVLLLGGSMERTIDKYSNKALRLAFLEAGHIAQNAYMYAAVKNFGIFEYAGFSDSVVVDNVGRKDFIPLVSLVFGGSAKKEQVESTLERIERELDSNIVSTIQIEILVYKENILGYYSATVYNRESHCVSGASSWNIEMAKIKALSEAYERYFTDYKNICKTAKEYTADMLTGKKILNVKDFTFLETLKPIPNTNMYKYIKGKTLGTNKTIYAPTKLIYYNSHSRDFPYIGVTTNGCASNLDLDISIRSGVMELLERDALMKMWHNKDIPRNLPKNIRDIATKKINFWKKLGVTMDIMDISTEFAPVILVAMFKKAKKINIITFGCAAGLDYSAALLKALEEIEPRYVHLDSTVEDDLNSAVQCENSVSGVEEHMKFYYCKNNFKKLDWLLKSKRKKTKNSDLVFDIKNLSKIDIHTFIIKRPSKSNPFWITKSISKHLVPIYFGKNNMPVKHKMLRYGKTGFNKNIHFFS